VAASEAVADVQEHGDFSAEDLVEASNGLVNGIDNVTRSRAAPRPYRYLEH
jgi:hypothetical protein